MRSFDKYLLKAYTRLVRKQMAKIRVNEVLAAFQLSLWGIIKNMRTRTKTLTTQIDKVIRTLTSNTQKVNAYPDNLVVRY